MTHTETPWTADNVVFKGLTLIMNASDKIVKQAELDTEYMFKCVNEHDTLTKRVAELEELMREMDEYLDTHKETTICNGSILHTKIKQTLKKGESGE